MNKRNHFYYSNNDFIRIDDEAVSCAREMFEKIKSDGLIKNSSFKDSCWITYDEYSFTGIYFEFDSERYANEYYFFLHMELKEFTEKLKAYVILLVGKLVFESLQSIVNDIKRLLRTPLALLFENDELFLSHPARVIEFFSMITNDENQSSLSLLMDYLDKEYTWKTGGKQRKLASFESYFLFNDIINEYWQSDITNDDRLFYCPLYLWWKISAVIPLRPREFILTPRDCLIEKEDGFYVRLRRSNLKGKEKGVTYTIQEDYYICEYKITDELASVIKWYIKQTENDEVNRIDTAFTTENHYLRWRQSRHSNSRYLTYVNLRCILRYFYKYVIEEQKHMEVIYERGEGPLGSNCIEYIHLGDTRHIALINIIAEGGTPVIAMALAGHDNINMASHYYTNITSLIECKTYRQYKKMISGTSTYAISRNNTELLKVHDFTFLQSGGRCFSERYAKGDYSDCEQITNSLGEIGDCRECSFYRNQHDSDFFDNDDSYKQRIMDDCRYLERMVSRARKSKGDNEEILPALMRLQRSSLTYQQYLEEKMKQEGED